MFRAARFLSASLTSVFLLFLAPLPAQDAARAPSLQIQIADEPTNLDPTAVLPPEVTRVATVEFKNAPLSDVAKWMQDELKLEVVLDEPAKEAVERKVTDRLARESLDLLLDRLESIDVGWYLQGGVLHLTSVNVANERLTTVSYNIGELLDAKFEVDKILDVLRRASGGPWNDSGAGTTVRLGDVLMITQKKQTHLEIKALQTAMLKPARRMVLLDRPQHAALREKLSQPLSVNFDEIPYGQAVAELSKQLQTELRVSRSLAATVSLDRQPVTLVAEKQPLAAILKAMSAGKSIAPEVRSGGIWLTLGDGEAGRRYTALYDVRDLCLDFDESSALQDALQAHVLGTETAAAVTFPKPGLMVLRQPLPKLDQVSRLLETYRAALKASKARPDTGFDPKKVELRIYRVSGEMAADLEVLIPFLVAPESWQAADPARPGTIQKAASQSAVKPVEGQATGAGTLRPYSVLLINQTGENHIEIGKLLRRMEAGDGPLVDQPRPGAKKSFGSGYLK